MASQAPRVAAAPAGTPNGARDRGDGIATFALWAPWKESVHLIGDFNNWDLQADPLAVDERGLWCIEKQLDPGTHAYQFVIDGETTVGDPYARILRWAGGSSQPHALVEVGAQPYEWGDGGFGIKPLNQLVIYELHVGDFSPEGTFEGVTARLDYLASLGVDAIELMPIQEFPGDRSWGYNPAYFFTPEGSYGSPDDLKRLIDTAHQKGIGVLLDMVFNHTTG
ncbi:MAG: alpha-amylase family glycosyl hydrolase, partial [Chloroflexota bacterium]|nr:alpha-amylase family glycosyl hydrolase [Chloroflexota bacterium]